MYYEITFVLQRTVYTEDNHIRMNREIARTAIMAVLVRQTGGVRTGEMATGCWKQKLK